MHSRFEATSLTPVIAFLGSAMLWACAASPETFLEHRYGPCSDHAVNEALPVKFRSVAADA
jgi:hypothetical protein